jgi:pseudouridine kinase
VTAPARTLLGIGGAHIDRRGQMTVPFVPGASNPGTMREDVGGGTLNALRAAAQRGAKAAVLSVRGGDAAGGMVARVIKGAGITDLSVTFLDRATPSYTALLDTDGDVVAALADMGLYEIAFARQLRRASARDAIGRADAVLTDANLPADALQRLATLASAKPIFAIAISPAKVPRLSGIFPDLSCLFLNRREAALLTGLPAHSPPAAMVAALRKLGIARALMTSGPDAVVCFDATSTFCITPPVPPRIVDVTGAGDAMTGAAIAALLRGEAFDAAAREGVAAALLTLQSAKAVGRLDDGSFEEALAMVSPSQSLKSNEVPHVA